MVNPEWNRPQNHHGYGWYNPSPKGQFTLGLPHQKQNLLAFSHLWDCAHVGETFFDITRTNWLTSSWVGQWHLSWMKRYKRADCLLTIILAASSSNFITMDSGSNASLHHIASVNSLEMPEIIFARRSVDFWMILDIQQRSLFWAVYGSCSPNHGEKRSNFWIFLTCGPWPSTARSAALAAARQHKVEPSDWLMQSWDPAVFEVGVPFRIFQLRRAWPEKLRINTSKLKLKPTEVGI